MSEVPVSLPQVPAKTGVSVIAIVLSIVSALVAYGVLRTQYPFMVVSSKFDIGMGASDEARLALISETDRVNRLNATIIMTIGGGLLGLSLAYAAAACCALPIRLVAGVVWGGVLGAAAGWIASTAIPYIVPRSSIPSLTSVGAAHGLLFGLIGAGLGLMVGGFAKNSQQMVSQLIKGGIAGVAGGFIYAIIVGFVAPGETASQLVPANAMAQLLWLAIPFAAVGSMTGR